MTFLAYRAFPELFALVGGQVPDLRGYFLRGLGGNSAALGTPQGDAIRNIKGKFGAVFQGWTPTDADGPFTKKPSSDNLDGGNYKGADIYFDASRIVPVANEVRPINKSVRYLIRSRP
ncbi:MAG: hypothetical protein HDQ89_02330 [Desulfovibrio sp.]|nr:hypothetical protein [Desulfovibrio sp.]